jgi:RecA-family ATPase
VNVADFDDEDWPEGYGPAPVQTNVVPLRDENPPAWLDEVPPVGDPIQTPAPIVATPFAWRAEADIPRRMWLYGRHLLRRFVSVDVAAGGTGKSSVKIGEALAMASGRNLYDAEVHDGPLNVWLYNLEDPAEESERRIHATAKWFKIAPQDVDGRMFVDSGRDQRCVIATETEYGARIAQPVYEQIKAQIIERKIDVLIIDPFVSSHEVSENDNRAIDAVVKAWGRLADECNCSINLVHHVRKGNGTETNADSARGAKSLVDAARSVVVFNRMSPDEASAGRHRRGSARLLLPHAERQGEPGAAR